MIKPFTVVALLLAALIVYLFVTAPPPLDQTAARGPTVPVEEALALAAAENAAVRQLYTAEIVGRGKQVGLAFDEDWRQRDVEAGPLPALFLRETAMSLEKDPVRLGLFLGSDHPIRTANLFTGEQESVFERMREDRQPSFFLTADTGLHTAMFPDLAVAPPCVDCHNQHPSSPKNDWRLGDVMGATTWTYPDEELTVGELLELLAALRRGFGDAYGAYIDKTRTFSQPPEIGERWPRDGYYLPSPEVFLAEAERRTSPETLGRLLSAGTGG